MIRKIISNFIQDSGEALTDEQGLFAETSLVDSLPRNDLIFVGDTIKLDSSQIKSVVDQAHQLTENQISMWARYL